MCYHWDMKIAAIISCVGLLLGMEPMSTDEIDLRIVSPLELQGEVGPGPSAYAWCETNEIWITDPDNKGIIAHEIAHLMLCRSGLSGSAWHADLAYWVEEQYYPQCALLNTDEPTETAPRKIETTHRRKPGH